MRTLRQYLISTFPGDGSCEIMPGLNMNDLSDVRNLDELSGTVILNGYRVKVEPVSSASEQEETHADETVEEFVA